MYSLYFLSKCLVSLTDTIVNALYCGDGFWTRNPIYGINNKIYSGVQLAEAVLWIFLYLCMLGWALSKTYGKGPGRIVFSILSPELALALAPGIRRG